MSFAALPFSLAHSRQRKRKRSSHEEGLILMFSEHLSGLYEKATQTSLSDALK